jgi:hypothetical protein
MEEKWQQDTKISRHLAKIKWQQDTKISRRFVKINRHQLPIG